MMFDIVVKYAADVQDQEELCKTQRASRIWLKAEDHYKLVKSSENERKTWVTSEVQDELDQKQESRRNWVNAGVPENLGKYMGSGVAGQTQQSKCS